MVIHGCAYLGCCLCHLWSHHHQCFDNSHRLLSIRFVCSPHHHHRHLVHCQCSSNLWGCSECQWRRTHHSSSLRIQWRTHLGSHHHICSRCSHFNHQRT